MEQETSKVNTVKIVTQLTLNDFKNYNFYLVYRKWSMWILSIIGSLSILNSILSLFSEASSIVDIFISFMMGFILVGLAPMMILVTAKRNFSSHKELSAEITYEFDDQFVQASNAYGQTKTPWTNFFKVLISKNWLILYRSRQTANLIPMRYLTQQQIDMIKQFVLSNKIKANFKK